MEPLDREDPLGFSSVEQNFFHNRGGIGNIFHLLMKILKFAIRDKELVSVLLSIDNKS